MNPSNLARFTKVIGDRHDNMTISPRGPGEAILISVGLSFFGALMPVRLPDHEPFSLPDWLGTEVDDDEQPAGDDAGS